MSIIDTTPIAKQARTGIAAWTSIPIPDGTTSFRIEPDVLPADWAAGLIVHIVANIIKGGATIESNSANLFTSLDRDGNVATPYLQFNCPLNLKDPANPIPIPWVGCSVSGSIILNKSATVGMRFTAAPDPTKLPATLPAPVTSQQAVVAGK